MSSRFGWLPMLANRLTRPSLAWHARVLWAMATVALISACSQLPTVPGTSRPDAYPAPGIETSRPTVAPPSPSIQRLLDDARSLSPLVRSRPGSQFLNATAELPAFIPRHGWRHERTRAYITTAGYDTVKPDERGLWRRADFDEDLYWNTRYGSPLVYARVIDIMAQHGLSDFAGSRVLDYGYGHIGHLRLMASLGAEVVGVDVDSLLPSLYSLPTDQGIIRGPRGRVGSIQLVNGRWPAQTARQVADGFDWIISKNTLKRGYVKPDRAGVRAQVDLSVPEAEFLRQIHRALKPGGKFLIYNISPAQNPPDKPYLAHADGRPPFTRAALEAAGFQVLAYDVRDDDAARNFGRVLGWDRLSPPIDLERGLFAQYTLVSRD
jgi:SAM-dependent methyltransferase